MSKTKLHVYLSSGWFSEKQEKARQIILSELKKTEFTVYSPKEDLLYTPGDDPQHVFQTNIDKIIDCDLVVASTEGKDLGTVFECGVAHSIGKPIVYLWQGKGSFNLMLSQSSHRVVSSASALQEVFKEIMTKGYLERKDYKGDIE